MILVFGAGQLGQELDVRARQGDHLTLLSRDTDIADETAVAAAIAQSPGRSLWSTRPPTPRSIRPRATPGAAQLSNAIGAAVLADACAEAGVPMFDLSTDYVFDGTKTMAPTVKTIPSIRLGCTAAPSSPAKSPSASIYAEHIILRTSWVFGVYGRNFLKTIAARATGNSRSSASLPTSAVVGRRRRIDARRLFCGFAPPQWPGRRAGVFTILPAAGRPRGTGLPSASVPKLQLPGPVATRSSSRSRSAEYPTQARRPGNSALDSGLFARTFGFAARHWEEATDATVATLLGPVGAPPRPGFFTLPVAARRALNKNL